MHLPSIASDVLPPDARALHDDMAAALVANPIGIVPSRRQALIAS